MNASGLDVEIEDVSERISAVAIQGPLSRDVLEAATEASWGDLAYFGRRASRVGRIPVDVSRTGYTGDLGYEVWVESSDAVELWDALVRAGRPYGIRPAGMLALDVARIEAGLILVEVDFDSVRRALIPEQSFSPFELGVLGRFVDFGKRAEFVGRRALEREQARGGAPRRLVGLELEWDSLEGLYREKGLMPTLDPAASREPLPLYARGRQVGKATSTTWSPILKKVVALASVRADHSSLGTRIDIRVDGRGAAPPDAREGRGAAVLRPDPQDLDGRRVLALSAGRVPVHEVCLLARDVGQEARTVGVASFLDEEERAALVALARLELPLAADLRALLERRPAERDDGRRADEVAVLVLEPWSEPVVDRLVALVLEAGIDVVRLQLLLVGVEREAAVLELLLRTLPHREYRHAQRRRRGFSVAGVRMLHDCLLAQCER